MLAAFNRFGEGAQIGYGDFRDDGVFANGGGFDHDLQRSGQNRRHSKIFARSNARSAFVKPARSTTLAFETLFTWGFAEANHPSKCLEGFEGVSLEWDLQMVGVLTISTRIVVKTAAIGKLGPGVASFFGVR